MGSSWFILGGGGFGVGPTGAVVVVSPLSKVAADAGPAFALHRSTWKVAVPGPKMICPAMLSVGITGHSAAFGCAVAGGGDFGGCFGSFVHENELTLALMSPATIVVGAPPSSPPLGGGPSSVRALHRGAKAADPLMESGRGVPTLLCTGPGVEPWAPNTAGLFPAVFAVWGGPRLFVLGGQAPAAWVFPSMLGDL